MKKIFLVLIFLAAYAWSIPKPMESIENYNVLMVHGAYGSEKGIKANANLKEADSTSDFLGKATLGSYTSDDRITKWIGSNIFEEPDIGSKRNPSNAYIYNWRSFTNPANSSLNNAYELGSRTWNRNNERFGHRRSLMEEAQEVKSFDLLDDNGERKYGQSALELIRKNPDLYRQLASRYILIGHSMGGVVSREYVQGNFYNGDVDKIITLDSPHEGTGALNMQVAKDVTEDFWGGVKSNIMSSIPNMSVTGSFVPLLFSADVNSVAAGVIGIVCHMAIDEIGDAVATIAAPEKYHKDDPLVHYVDPKRAGYQTIDSLNRLPYVADSLPMFRVLASQHGITFTDPANIDNGASWGQRFAVDDNYRIPFLNIIAQFHGSGNFSARYVNMLTSAVMGFAGIPTQTTGSSIIPASSSEGRYVDVLNDKSVDVRKEYFNAAPNASSELDAFATSLDVLTNGIIAVDQTLDFFFPEAAKALKIALAMEGAIPLANHLETVLSAGVSDLTVSHTLPLDASWLDEAKSKKNEYLLMQADSSYTPYLMEDFLYERPFVNLALNDTATLKKLQGMNDSVREESSLNRNCFYIGSKNGVNCAIGLFRSANDLNSTQNNQSLSGLTTPLRFKSESDWSKIGVKVDRWERVPGLAPDGTQNDTLVPIRHVERYEVPALTVENWIEKYSFVVDDLMPHRLRQIRMNFNYQKEIAWECDVTKDPEASDACIVYEKNSNSGLRTIKKDKHPVLKNGRFDFVPHNYGFNNLGAFQKDNQNSITITTVNKIGLSNTQSFYYLFKATPNKLDPVWPKPNTVLNKVKNFRSHATALGYQGYRVFGAKDAISAGSSILADSNWHEMDMEIDYFYDPSRIGSQGGDSAGLVYDSSGAYFTSRLTNSNPTEGTYLWTYVADIRNMVAPEVKDSSNSYNVPFKIDRTIPDFVLNAERKAMNPDSTPFVARFTWSDSSNSPDIRAMRLTLERASGTKANPSFVRISEFPAMSDISAPEFALQWNDAARNSVKSYGDGLYRLRGYAIDYAVPDINVSNKMDSLVGAIMAHPGKIDSTLWPTAGDSVNASVVYEPFYVDTKAPVMSNGFLGCVSTEISEYGALSRPARNVSYAYATEDSLTNITYKIKEALNGQDSVPVAISWKFVSQDDSARIFRTGDSLWIKDETTETGSWIESSGRRLEDGDYIIGATVRDEAGNESVYSFSKALRVDKTAPYIESLVSSQLIYPDSARVYSATVVVDERHDVESNKNGMHCHYRVSGCGNTTGWKRIPDNALKEDSTTFSLDSLDGRRGKCYLEAVCIDAAGNHSVKTDLFYIGERSPEITSPKSVSYSSLVAITGIAPPISLDDSLNTVYRLRYASMDSVGDNDKLEWKTENIFVVPALQDKARRNQSKISQSNDGVLGYLDRNLGNGLYMEGKYAIELATCAGAACSTGVDSLWKADTSEVFLGENRDSLFYENIQVHFDLDTNLLLVGMDSLGISLYLTGPVNSDYSLRVYAKDSKDVGLFDESIAKMRDNPYHGVPADTLSDSAAVWFYESDGKCHLQWKGLPLGDSMQIFYDSATFGNICEGPNGNVENCVSRSSYGFGQLAAATESFLKNYPEWMPPSIVNREMLLTGNSGHLVITATGAFRISIKKALGDTMSSKMHVYFGDKTQSGFYWITDKEFDDGALSPTNMGWTVNPRTLGLSFKWNGTMETGMYPAEGKMKIYAEVTENVQRNPRVILDSAEVELKLPPLEISLPDTLPDFVLMTKDSVLVCPTPLTPEDSCERKAFKLGSIVVKYGVKYRDARVSAYIMQGTDTVAVLQDSLEMRANVIDSAYQVRWNGKKYDKENNEIVASAGVYALRIEAIPSGGNSQASVSKEVSFAVKNAETMRDMSPDDPKKNDLAVPAIFVSEANPDSIYHGVYRYEPIADYLVKAQVSSWELPGDYFADSIPLVGIFSGTQEILKYEPKRFSLAIRRHRQTLNLVIMAKLEMATVSAECTGEGVNEDPTMRVFYFLKNVSFNDNHRIENISIDKNIGDIGSGRGFSGTRYNSLTVYAFLEQMDYPFADKDGVEKIPVDTNQFAPIWEKTFQLPLQTDDNRYSKESLPFVYENDPDGCSVIGDSTVCVYGPKGYSNNTNEYNPNNRLFNVLLSPVDGVFYSEKDDVVNGCSFNEASRNKRIRFNLTLEIPDTAYWNAGFGRDNLVNRTIRYDHYNPTVFDDGSGNGYWKALSDKGLGVDSVYHDGKVWKKDIMYGLLTPQEVQHLPMYPASQFADAENIFLFSGENNQNYDSSRFDLWFYGAKDDDGDYFQVAVGKDVVARSNTDSVKSTDYIAAGKKVDFYVARNTVVDKVEKDSIDYPAGWGWMDEARLKYSRCPNSAKIKKKCFKYYQFASRPHYYYGDYTDSIWTRYFLTSDGYIRNALNTPIIPKTASFEQLFHDSVVENNNIGGQKILLSAKPTSRNYDNVNHRFWVALDTVTKVLKHLIDNHVNPSVDSLYVDAKDYPGKNYLSFSAKNDSMYIATGYYARDFVYRKSRDSFAKTPVRPKTENLPMSRLYRNDSEWTKDISVNYAKLIHLDSSEHTHLNVMGIFPSSEDMTIGFKPADSIKVKRPKELVEICAYLQKGHEYQVAYLNDSAFYTIPSSKLESKWRNGVKLAENDTNGIYRLGWFDVNRLQGSSQFLLLWGDNNKTSYNFSKFDMLIGRPVTISGGTTVKSLFEEAGVTFPKNSVDTVKNVTVRTVEASDYSFEVFNNLALKGPIVEVLPSMTFANTSALPRIQMKISREEMVAMRATPQTVRLYKVDFTGKRFVPLQNALYGFLNADGSAVMDGTDTLKCDESNKMTKTDCAGNDSTWAYLLISAETRTFSVFTAMASGIAETPSFSVTVLPEIASTANRTVRVDGISRFRLYVDDDSLWANRGDVTPPDTLAFTADSNGFARIALPSRGNAIDTSSVFVVALGEPDAEGNMEELPAAPAVARALTVNAQFACSVPSDSLWLGLDNGYMAYGASCTHPGCGLVSLYRDGRIVAEIRGEIPDTIIYDGSKTSGASGLGKISTGVYESRYVGVSALGMDMQIAGPRVYTDSLRPAIRNFSVQDSSEVLDRIFTATADVYDSESGIARVVVTPVFGGDTLRVMNVVPDSAGHVSASIRISRKQLAECTVCYLSMEMRVEDYGHNHAEQGYTSEKLYPYPTELALWYPAREGSGKITHELLGTGHDLDLRKVNNPWGSDVGLYFGRGTDFASGNGLVDFGSTPSYSFEAHIKRGSGYSIWRRVLGFAGVNGLDIELMQRGGVLKLVEGSHSWESELLPISEKSWAHVVVTVDSAHVKFYVDGELKKVRDSGISQERELEGAFSMGKNGSAPSYLGNIADIRMYSRALTAAEVEELSKPVTDAGEVSDVIVVAVKDMDAVSGFSNEFSCSVAGNKYLVSGDSATLTMSVIVENAADYNVVLYARSATVGDKSIYVGESSLLAGMASVSNTWRAVTVFGVSVHLAAGTHTLTLRVPAGVQIGGAALMTANIPASMIAWGVSTSDKVAGITPADTVRKVKSYLRYEGYPETSTLRPRIRLRNVSNEPLNGFSVRYYFRGEDASQAGVDRYWPNYGPTFPAVHSESANTGYVEWSFAETIPVAGTVFGGDGPHFGLFNSDFTPWNASDDPSFVDPNSGMAANVAGFYENVGVVVLDKDNNLIGGSCAEMEDPLSLETKVRVLAADMRGDNQASGIHFKVENTGNVALKNFDVRYYFFVEEGLAPDYELDDRSKCSSASMESLGSGRWQVTVHCDSSLAVGKTWQNPVKFALHLPGWPAMWNTDDDPSHDSLGMTLRVARGICVFDSTGYMLYGNTPVWALPAPDEVNPDSVYNVDFGYRAPGNSIPVIRTPEGLVVTMDNWSYVELSLVTAKGAPVKNIFAGTLAPGEQFVRVDWAGIDMNKTYLMFKVNGSIKSTKNLSLL